MSKGYVVGTTKPEMRISWDSTVCIDFLDREPSQFEFLRPIVEDAIAKRLIIVVSSLAISETIHLKSVADLLEQQRLIQSFFDASYVHVHAYERFIAERARDLRRSYKIDSADAGHVATAAFADCHVFLTDDGNAQKTTRNLLYWFSVNRRMSAGALNTLDIGRCVLRRHGGML
jgi:predicted nucleic acid-binding protein